MIRLIVLIGISLFGIQSFAQDSLSKLTNYKAEISLTNYYSDYFETAVPRINAGDLPNFFPTSGELENMTLEQKSYVSVISYQLSYTRWFAPIKRNEKKRYGIGFVIGTNDGFYFNQTWNNRTRYAFDTVATQENGTKYPVDSVFHHFYDSKMIMSFLQLGVSACKRKRIGEKTSFEWGIKSLVNIKVSEETKFIHSIATSIETLNQHYEVSKESATTV